MTRKAPAMNNTGDVKEQLRDFRVPSSIYQTNVGYTTANDPIAGHVMGSLVLAHYAGILWRNLKERKFV